MLVRREVLRCVAACVLTAALLTGCGGSTTLLAPHAKLGGSFSSAAAQPLQIIATGRERLSNSYATKNTTRITGVDPIADAADVALAVYPPAPGTHPTAVVLAPSGDWEASLAASVLVAAPIRAPLLFSSGGSLPPVSQQALNELAPSGANQIDNEQVIRIGQDVAKPKGLRATTIEGRDPYTIAANIDKFIGALDQRRSINVVIASSTAPAYAMPAAGWAAESGEPILFVDGATIPAATRSALEAHQKPHIYVLGPPSVIPDHTLSELRKYGSVKRITSGNTPESSAVAFARYRDPACPYAQQCAHVPGSFGWAIDSPGHGYTLINADRTLDAAAAAPLSGSGDYAPELLTDTPGTLPPSVLNYFLQFAASGYNQLGPTVASFNHGWVIGDVSAVSFNVQAQLDHLLEVVPVSK